MPDHNIVIQAVYAAFNNRDIDAALALMTEEVSWPKASEGGKVVGKEAIRAYWTRQWQEFDPHVEPLATVVDASSKLRVTVHQLVKTPAGEVLFEGNVLHTYTLRNGLIAAMDLDDAAEAAGPSAAFAHRR